jgi:hypothetical protein
MEEAAGMGLTLGVCTTSNERAARAIARGGRPVYVNARLGRTDFRKGSLSI